MPPEKDWDAQEIVPGLWVGGLSAAQNDKGLAKRGIWNVVTIAERLKPQVAWVTAESDKINLTVIELEDHPCADFLAVLPKIIKTIDQGMKPRETGETGVLVHCASGISRSVSGVVAWLMFRRGMKYEEAMQLVKAHRKHADPNAGFMQCFKLLEANNNDIKAARKQWIKANQKSTDMDVVKLRRAADRLCERAAELEEQFAKDKKNIAAGTSTQEKALCNLLKKLLRDINDFTPSHGVDDPYARSVRDSTLEKVMRLLSELKCPLPDQQSDSPVEEPTISPTDNNNIMATFETTSMKSVHSDQISSIADLSDVDIFPKSGEAMIVSL